MFLVPRVYLGCEEFADRARWKTDFKALAAQRRKWKELHYPPPAS